MESIASVTRVLIEGTCIEKNETKILEKLRSIYETLSF